MSSRPDEETIPVRIRTRRTLGNGEFESASTVSCARRAAEVRLETCLGCEHCSAMISTRAGRAAHVYCHDPEAAREAVVHLPAPVSRAAESFRESLAARTPLCAIMTADVLCVRADVSVEEVTALLLERGIGGVPVVDDQGRPLGVVSRTDLVRERTENEGPGELGRATAGDVMAGMKFVLPENATIAQAAALMAFEGVHRLPVTCNEGTVVGIVSSLDILRWIARQNGYLVRE